MTITTTECGRFGHPEFALVADEAVVPEVYLRELAKTIEQMVAEGETFQAGETFQVGWMLAKVEADSSSNLALVEPDMEAFPIRWVPGVTNTLRQKMLQVFMLDSVSLRHEVQMPDIRQSLIACEGYTAAEFFMSRSAGTHESDSGWFVGCLDRTHDHNDPSNLLHLSLYETYLNQRGIQAFVGFPVDSMIVIDERNGVTILKDRPLAIVRGSFLDAWLERWTGDRTERSYPE